MWMEWNATRLKMMDGSHKCHSFVMQPQWPMHTHCFHSESQPSPSMLAAVVRESVADATVVDGASRE